MAGSYNHATEDEGALRTALEALRILARRANRAAETVEKHGGDPARLDAPNWQDEQNVEILAANLGELAGRKKYQRSLEKLTEAQKAQVEAIEDQYRLTDGVSERFEPGIIDAVDQALSGGSPRF